MLTFPHGVAGEVMMDVFVSAYIALGVAGEMVMDVFVSAHIASGCCRGNDGCVFSVCQCLHCSLVLPGKWWWMCMSVHTLPLGIAREMVMDVYVSAYIAPWCCWGIDDGYVCEWYSPLVLQGKWWWIFSWHVLASENTVIDLFLAHSSPWCCRGNDVGCVTYCWLYLLVLQGICWWDVSQCRYCLWVFQETQW